MKNICTLGFCLFTSVHVFSQNIGIGTSSPHPSAQLDISNNTKGLLIPRMTTPDVGAISNPAKGLLVYDSVRNQLMVNMGTTSAPNWQTIVYYSGWNLAGNVNTNPSLYYIGTNDNQPLKFRVNNLPAGELNPTNGNSFFGYKAGVSNTTGYSNVAIGNGAMYLNNVVSNTVAIGDSALYNNSLNTVSSNTSQRNVAIGSKAMYSTVGGFDNTAVGFQSQYSNTSGSLNTAVGTMALRSNTYGSYNTALGSNALGLCVSGLSNTAIGEASMQNTTDAYYNTAVGYSSLFANTTGSDNTAIGYKSLQANTTGENNTAVGNSTLYANTTGYNNIAIGLSPLYANITGWENVAIGTSALVTNTQGDHNTAVGTSALYYNTTGANNCSYGYRANTGNTTGLKNVALGVESMYLNNAGSYNVAVGVQAGYHTVNAQFNTCIGYTAGDAYDMGYNNTILGANCDVGGNGFFNCIAIGQATVSPASSAARIGNGATNSIGGQVGWSTLSDGRFKTDVKENVKGLDFILQLRPVTYYLDAMAVSKKLKENHGMEWSEQMKNAIKEKTAMLQSGFIAQEVETAANKVGYDFSGVDKPKNENDLYGLRYGEFVVPLVKAVQEQQELIKSQQQQIDVLNKRLAALEKK
ncbi:MAG: tail fiber domain-containing protein [Ferruginibacter sp.]